MIAVKVELWPRGSEDHAREIGRAYIANVGGDATRGNYDVAVCRRNTTAVPVPIHPEGPKPTRVGAVNDYPRLSYNMWRLIVRALRSAFPEEDRRPAFPAPFDVGPFQVDLEQEIEDLKRERDQARADARHLANAIADGNAGDDDIATRAIAYPIEPA